jgi:hypothetical protein
VKRKKKKQKNNSSNTTRGMFKIFSNYWQNKNKLWKTIMIISIALFFLILAAAIWFGAQALSRKEKKSITDAKPQQQSEEENVTYKDQCDGCIRRKIDGVFVKPEEANLPPVAVMIDNHPDARPAAGIEKANLIYEAEVEGNYTRYMSVFATAEKIDRIGPVRSARPYFVDWAYDLGAVYAHCGGSPEALVDLTQKNMTDLNEFYNGQYFWRADNRTAPHNVFTSSDDLNKFLAKKDITSSSYPVWQFKEDSPNKSSSSQEIKINYSLAIFQVKWEYNPTDNDYIRYLADKPDLTIDNNVIAAKNIIIQVVPATVVDDKLRLRMGDVGSGAATICLDGDCQKGEWNKADAATRTKFTYENGEEIKLNAGQTWIEVVKPEIKIEY